MPKSDSVQIENIETLLQELRRELGQARSIILWFIEQYGDENGEVWIPWGDLASLNHRMAKNYAPYTFNGAWNTRNEGLPGHAIIKANLKEKR